MAWSSHQLHGKGCDAPWRVKEGWMVNWGKQEMPQGRRLLVALKFFLITHCGRMWTHRGKSPLCLPTRGQIMTPFWLEKGSGCIFSICVSWLQLGGEVSSMPKYHYSFGFATANLHIYITGPLPVRHLRLKPQFTTLFPYSLSALFLVFDHQSQVSGNLFQKCKWVICCPVLAFLKMSFCKKQLTQ